MVEGQREGERGRGYRGEGVEKKANHYNPVALREVKREREREREKEERVRVYANESLFQSTCERGRETSPNRVSER